jgi:hypothetical protein
MRIGGRERAEVRQRRHHIVVGAGLRKPARRTIPLEPLGELDEHFDQIRDRAARGADVRHEQHRVAAGLVDLDPVLIHEVRVLEGVAVDARARDLDRDPARVDHELVVAPRPPHRGEAVRSGIGRVLRR